MDKKQCTSRYPVGGAAFRHCPTSALVVVLLGALVALGTFASTAEALQSQTITFNPLPNKTWGDPPFTISATASSGLAVSFASLTTPVCTVRTQGSTTTVTIVTPGTCTIQASQAGNKTYAPAPNVNQSFTVFKKSQAISFGALSDKTYASLDFTVTATASSGLTVTFISTTTVVCTVSGTTVSIVGVGTCTIEAQQAGNTYYSAAPNVDESFTVTKGNQTIFFGSLGAKHYGDPPFTVSANAASGLPVTFISTTAAVCTLSGTTVTMIAGGTCTIQAQQAGNSNYNPAPTVNQSFTVYVAQPSFAAAATYSVGQRPTTVVAGDFNNDGITDLAVVNGLGGSVSIFLGSGSGTFTAGTTLTAVGSPSGVAVGDFNGDDKVDLAITDWSNNAVRIYAGNGNGTFTMLNTVTVARAAAVAVADVDGDGKLDLVVASADYGSDTGQTAFVLLGNGDGTFRAPVPYATGPNPVAVVIADFNGDGKQDLAVANADNNTVAIMLGNGDGAFTPAVYYTAHTTPVAIGIGDFNRDGKVDLAVVNENSDDVSILLGNGDGTFGPTTNFPALFSPSSMAVADFNGDGLLDIAVSNHGNNWLSILVGNGNGTFVNPSTTYTVGQGPTGLIATDLNHDGKPDLVAANTYDNTMSVLLSVTTGSASPSFTSVPPSNGTFNAAYSFTVTATGIPAPTFTVSSGALPTGLTLNGTSGVINGTPNAAGTFSGALKATNGVSPDALQAFNIIIAPASQTITFGPLANQGFGTPPFTLSATASSGLTVSFSSLTTSVCTISGNTVTLVAGGSCTIQASQGGNANYAAAPNVNRTFTVTPASQTITFGSQANQALCTPPFTINATASSGLTVSYSSLTTPVCTASGNTVSLVATGTCTIRALQAGNASYSAAANVDQSFAVTPSTVYHVQYVYDAAGNLIQITRAPCQ